MRQKFQKMNQAVERLRNKVQDAFNTVGQTFMWKDGNEAKRYQICCEFPDLSDNANFPNVSSERKEKIHFLHAELTT